MAIASSWRGPLACLGLAVCLGMLRFSHVLWVTMMDGEVSLVRGLSIMLGVLWLAVASLRLLMRRAMRGRMFLAAAVFMLISLTWFHSWMYGYWLWLGAATAMAGAIMAFVSSRRGKSAP